MTTEVNDTIDRYEINGTGPYPFSVRIFDEDDLTVTALESGEVDPITLTVNSHFTVSGVNDEDGGTITLINSAETTYDGYTLDIRSNVTVEQPTSIKNQGSFSPAVHEKAFDRQNRQIQDLTRKVNQKWGYPDNVNLGATMTSRTAWLGKFPYVNEDGEIEPAVVSGTPVTQSIIGELLYPITPAEQAVGVTPVNDAIPSHEQLGYINPLRYGLTGDDATSNDTAITSMAEVAAQLGACKIRVPDGIYRYSSMPNWAGYPGISIEGESFLGTIFKHTATGVALTADAFEAGLTGDDATAPFVSLELLNFTIQGNTNTTYLGVLQGLARGKIDLNGKDCNTTTGIAFHVKGCMENKQMDFTVSSDLNSMGFVPSEGVRIDAGIRDGTNVGNSSNNDVYLRVSGPPIGVRLSGADNNTVKGAAESCATYGFLVATGSRSNTLINFGMENPGSTADFTDGGGTTKLINCYAAHKAILQGERCVIDGGQYERIEVQSGAVDNEVKNIEVNHWREGSGGFYDSGTRTKFSNIAGTNVTATFATSVMTVTTVGQGVLAVGQEVFATGVSSGTTISSLGTGTGGAGTYNLSTSPGTLSSRNVQTNGRLHIAKSRTSITVGASVFTWENNTGEYVEVIVQAGTVTQIRQGRDGDYWLKSPTSPTAHILAPWDVVEVSYSSIPEMSYVPTNGGFGG